MDYVHIFYSSSLSLCRFICLSLSLCLFSFFFCMCAVSVTVFLNLFLFKFVCLYLSFSTCLFLLLFSVCLFSVTMFLNLFLLFNFCVSDSDSLYFGSCNSAETCLYRYYSYQYLFRVYESIDEKLKFPKNYL